MKVKYRKGIKSMKYKEIFLTLCLLVSLISLSCNTKEADQSELKDPFIEVGKRMDGGLSVVQAKGKKLYNLYCIICHGEGGKGDGFNAYNLDPRPADLTEVCKIKEDEYIIKVATGGTKDVGKTALCPPYGKTIQIEDIEAIISYLKTFP